jgi:hypothetical protein
MGLVFGSLTATFDLIPQTPPISHLNDNIKCKFKYCEIFKGYKFIFMDNKLYQIIFLLIN